MTKQQKNKAFAKMLKEFPKTFGRVSFRERLMLRTAFDYITEEVIADIKANCDLAIEGRDVKIMELERQIEKMKCCQNCKNLLSLEYGEFSCDLYGECKHCSKWEIKEND